jgi:hypothetical protein
MMATAAPPAVYAGVREIQSGGAMNRELATARYDVTERYAVVRRQGRVATLRGTIAYDVVDPPAQGLVLTAATIDEQEQVDADGSVRLLSYHRITHAANVRGKPLSSSSADVRSVERSFAGGETIIPRSLKPHREVLSLAGTERRTESDVGSSGSNSAIGTYAESDVRRTTLDDGSFEEGGHVEMGPSMHRIRQQADGSANAYDTVPGFFLHDVTIGAPEGTGAAARIAVTVKTQGRTVGPTPIDTHDYVVPVWYAPTWPAPLATATLTVDKPRPPDARCALGTAPLVPVVIERKQIDVTGQIVEEREERDLDASRRELCRLTSTTTRRYDVTSGAATGATIDTTVVHATGPRSRA